MAKTLSELKKDAKTGKLFATMLIRLGKECKQEDLPELLQGSRQIISSNSVGIKLRSQNGDVSELRIPCANLVEYTEDSLTVYFPGYRKPTAEEQAILDEWDSITKTKEYQEQAHYDCLTDSSVTYRQEVAFFKNHNALYLRGYEKERGLFVDTRRKHEGYEDFIRDDKIRGEIEMYYKIEKMEAAA